MKLLRRNANLCAKAEFTAVRKARGRIDINRRCVHFPLKAMRIFYIARDNAFGMSRSISVNVLHRSIEIRYDTNGENHIAVFRAPVFLLCFFHGRNNRTGLFAAAQLDPCRRHRFCHLRQKGFSDIFMDEQRLHRIANAAPIRLGVYCNILRHIKICTRIDKGMANACPRLNHRNAAVLNHMLNQPCAAAWNDDI